MAAKKTVLIVDDDEMILNSLEVLVKLGGFTAITATDGKAALQKIETARPDVVILDLVLPGKSGPEVLKLMHDGWAAALPVIVITGQGPEHPAVIEAKAEPQVRELLLKPIRRELLVAALNRALGL